MEQPFSTRLYSRGLEQHVEHVRPVLEFLRANTLMTKWSKCSFGSPLVEYLGHIVTTDGVTTNP